MHLTVDRDGKTFQTTVTPVLDDRIGAGYAGWDERGEIQLATIEPGYPRRQGRD